MEREFEIVEVQLCPVCNNQPTGDIIEKYDDRFGQPDMFAVDYCKDCNIAFLKNKIQEKDLPGLYRKYYGKDTRSSVKSNNLKLILEKLKLDKIVLQWLAGNKNLLDDVRKGSKVLEIGSGYSPELRRGILSKKLDWTGLEVDEDSVNNLRRDGLKVIHGTIKLNTIQEKYDYIISSQSIEHQYDINDFFIESKKLLKRGGRIIFTTPNFDSRYRKIYKERWINWHVPYHIVLLSERGVEALCQKHGFEISRYFTYTPTSWYMLQSSFDLPSRGQKNMNFNFNFSLLKQLVVSFWLRIFEGIERNSGDCIYCEIRMK